MIFSLAGIVGSASVDNQRTKAIDHAYIARYAGAGIQVMCRLGRTAGKLDPAICATGKAASMRPAARENDRTPCVTLTEPELLNRPLIVVFSEPSVAPADLVSVP